MPHTRTSKGSAGSHFEGFAALPAHKRAQLAVSHHSEVTLEDAVLYFDDVIKQEVAAMGFNVSEPIKTGSSEKYYNTFQCHTCPQTRRPEQFWKHFFSTSRATDRCEKMRGSDGRECIYYVCQICRAENVMLPKITELKYLREYHIVLGSDDLFIFLRKAIALNYTDRIFPLLLSQVPRYQCARVQGRLKVRPQSPANTPLAAQKFASQKYTTTHKGHLRVTQINKHPAAIYFQTTNGDTRKLVSCSSSSTLRHHVNAVDLNVSVRHHRYDQNCCRPQCCEVQRLCVILARTWQRFEY